MTMETISRNSLCPCGSGEKYKKCCLFSDSSHIVPEDTVYSIDMKGLEEIFIPDDRDEAFLCQEILTHTFVDEEEPWFAVETLHILLKKYPYISDLWALLIIGYKNLGCNCRARVLLKKNLIKFPKNRTIEFLGYLEKISPSPKKLSFELETLTQIFLWGEIRIIKAFEQGNSTLAWELFEEMITNAALLKEHEHWVLTEVFFLIAMEMGIDYCNERLKSLTNSIN